VQVGASLLWGQAYFGNRTTSEKGDCCRPLAKEYRSRKGRGKKAGSNEYRICDWKLPKAKCGGKGQPPVSSIAFHHVIDEEKGKAVKIMHDLLEDNGRVAICDPMFFFEPEENPERFNQIYRYLAPKVTPESVYKAYFEPYFIKYKDYVYTWDDMKKYTTENERYYKVSDMIRLFERAGFTIEKTDEHAPFFGILCAKEVKNV
jgi:hypothetical protein